MRLLVTGAAGFIGSHLCERLIADGHDVIGLDAFTDYYEHERKRSHLLRVASDPRFSLVEADLVDVDLADVLDGVAGVFHLAAQPGVRGSWGDRFEVYVRNNVICTQRLLEAVKSSARDISVVTASSSSVYGATEGVPVGEDALTRPLSPYGVTKLASEGLASLYAEAYGLRVSSLRYFTVFGPRQRPDMAFASFIESALEGRPVRIFGDGEASRDFTYVADAVDATVRALHGPPSVYNVGGGLRTTITAAVEVIGSLLGYPVEVERVGAVPGDVRHTAADTARARDLLGWSPRTTLEDGLRAQIEWVLREREERKGRARGEGDR